VAAARAVDFSRPVMRASAACGVDSPRSARCWARRGRRGTLMPHPSA